MAKRMRLVPDSLYKHLVQQNLSDPAEHSLQEDKKNVLTAEDIPDDLKLMLYQDFARQLYDKQQKDAQKPIIVKSVDKPVSSEQKKEIEKVDKPDSSEQKKEAEIKNDKPDTKQIDYIKNMVASKRCQGMLDSFDKIGITINKKNNIVINDQPIQDSNVVDILKCLSNANISRDGVKGLDEVVAKLKTSSPKASIFPPGVRRALFLTPSSTPKRRITRSMWSTLKLQ